jgi:hypothetical protein
MMFSGTNNDLGTWQEGVGAEEYGPPTPTSTQLTVQAVRDTLTTGIDKTTVMYIAVGLIGAYALYNYFYAEA